MNQHNGGESKAPLKTKETDANGRYNESWPASHLKGRAPLKTDHSRAGDDPEMSRRDVFGAPTRDSRGRLCQTQDLGALGEGKPVISLPYWRGNIEGPRYMGGEGSLPGKGAASLMATRTALAPSGDRGDSSVYEFPIGSVGSCSANIRLCVRLAVVI